VVKRHKHRITSKQRNGKKNIYNFLQLRDLTQHNIRDLTYGLIEDTNWKQIKQIKYGEMYFPRCNLSQIQFFLFNPNLVI
jgi:hypothetical protein